MNARQVGSGQGASPARRAVAALWLGSSLLILVGACGASKTSNRSVTYRDTARANYDRAMAELKDENYPEALKFFTFVKNKFPFSRYSTLAELRMADTLFAQDKHIEAIDAYKLFAKFHPTHPQVLDGYTTYRVCQAYIAQIPSDWFLVPPSYEKEQSSARDALRELQIALKSYPNSKYLPKLKALHARVLRKLADHELYVARFYLERDKPKATILRLEGVLKRFPAAGVHPEVMLLLGQTYLKLNQRNRALETFASLIRKYPDDHHAAKAKLYVQYLTQRN